MAITCIPFSTLKLNCPLVKYSLPAIEPTAEPIIESIMG